MNAERLLAHFERISEAPDAIARLRRFILDLAVRGKLVEQDPDEATPAQNLSELRKQKDLAYAVEGLRARKPITAIQPTELWFNFPHSWMLCSFDDALVIVSGVTKGQRIPYGETSVEVPYLRVANVQRGWLDLSEVKSIAVRISDVDRYRLANQDILMTEGGDWDKLGRAAIWRGEITRCIHQNHIFRLRIPSDSILPEWVVLYANSECGRRFFEDSSKQTTNLASINLTQLRSCPIPLPPLAEQRRIVAKVDELMALCDQLEAARQQRQQCRGRLVAASLQRLNQPAADPVSFRNDASFALQVLPSHTTTPAQIKQLRQTILNLAVQGKLVEQSPEDEPAISWLLQRVEGNHSRRSRKTVATSVEGCQDSSISVLPETWLWVVLDDLVLVMDSGWSPQCEDHPRSSIESWGVLKTTAVQSLFFDERYHKELPSNLQPRPQHEAREGDILITRAGPKNRVGISCVIDKIEPRLMISDKIIRLRLAVGLSPCFVALALNAGHSSEAVEDAKSGMAVMQMNISQVKLRAVPIPLPPLAEQHRIVAMVDELMALCDQLEQQLSQADQQRRRLLEAVLAEALGGRLPTEQEDSHAAIA